jgi:hypothetical protein
MRPIASASAIATAKARFRHALRAQHVRIAFTFAFRTCDSR